MVYIYNSIGEKFTFESGMIRRMSSDVTTDLDTNVFPGSGPMSNQGVDSNGCGKNISITGTLYDTDSSVTSEGSNTIQDKKLMKYWLDALQDGAQIAVEFFSEYEEYSVESSGSTVFIDSVNSSSVTINAAMVKTKVYVVKVTFDEEEGNPDQIPFSMELWVGGI